MSHISLVTLGVTDLSRATAFYEALGWQRSAASVEGAVTFFRGTPVLALFGLDDLAADALLPTSPSPGGTAFALNVADEGSVDAYLSAAERAGASITKPPERTAWGGYSGYFRDPDGHLWEVAHNPGFPLDEQGRISLP
jgi:uncharacterized protein